MPRPMVMPPKNITGCAPYLSVNLPTMGEASATTKRVREKALEMVPRAQPKVSDQDSKKMRGAEKRTPYPRVRATHPQATMYQP